MIRARLPYMLVAASLASIAPAAGGQQGPSNRHSRVCTDLKPLLTSPPSQRLYSLILYADTSTGVQKFHVDIDRDGELETLELGCPGSSIEPSDPCSLQVHNSAGFQYTLEGMPLYLLRYKSVVYAVSGAFDEWPKTRHVRLLRLSGSESRLACTFVRSSK
jgi:hypothetical protein